MNVKFAKVIFAWLDGIGTVCDVELNESLTLNDIGADSLDRVDLSISLEKEFGIEIDINDLAEGEKSAGDVTLGRIWEAIERKTTDKNESAVQSCGLQE